jgi:organic hydroperoxide reductase OsmC/OhrA
MEGQLTKMKEHRYETSVRWNGNSGTGTEHYTAYSRDHEVSAAGKRIAIPGSSDPHFRGDASRYNPEELLVASLSSCHMLWYLHLCAVNNVVVNAYEDRAVGVMALAEGGSGHFMEVVLSPKIAISANSDPTTARRLHDEANRMCFIANSVNFPVRHHPSIESF